MGENELLESKLYNYYKFNNAIISYLRQLPKVMHYTF